MEQVPLDARSVLDELRSAAPPLADAVPRTWVPSASFDALLDDAAVTPVVLDEHLAWLHENCDLSHALAPPEGSGLRGWAKRWAHRIVLAVMNPYLVKVQDCIAETVRALDAVARRVDEQATAQLRSVTAVRTDLVDFARQVDERLGEWSRVVLVTARWADTHGESAAVLRLLAGALARRAEVEVVSLLSCYAPAPLPGRVRTRRDSVFRLHEVSASRAEPVQVGLLRGALAQSGGGRLPEISAPRLLELSGGYSPAAIELIASLEPDSVLLAGPETWWLPEAVQAELAGTRVVSVPLLGDDPLGDLEPLLGLSTEVDAVGVLSGAEGRLVAERIEAAGNIAPAGPEIVELEVAFAVNRPAAEQLMVGMSHFGRFVVVLAGFPDGSPPAARSPGHDYIRWMLGPVAVAEVALGGWVVSDREKSREVPVKPSRPNLWKLMSHAEVCIDLRPQGVVGRETLESLLLGTPVVVPEATVAAEHAQRSNGGLWYRDYAELFSAAKAIVDGEGLRGSLSTQGRAWAVRVHGDQHRFCEQVAHLALG